MTYFTEIYPFIIRFHECLFDRPKLLLPVDSRIPLKDGKWQKEYISADNWHFFRFFKTEEEALEFYRKELLPRCIEFIEKQIEVLKERINPDNTTAIEGYNDLRRSKKNSDWIENIADLKEIVNDKILLIKEIKKLD